MPNQNSERQNILSPLGNSRQLMLYCVMVFIINVYGNWRLKYYLFPPQVSDGPCWLDPAS